MYRTLVKNGKAYFVQTTAVGKRELNVEMSSTSNKTNIANIYKQQVGGRGSVDENY